MNVRPNQVYKISFDVRDLTGRDYVGSFLGEWTGIVNGLGMYRFIRLSDGEEISLHSSSVVGLEETIVPKGAEEGTMSIQDFMSLHDVPDEYRQVVLSAYGLGREGRRLAGRPDLGGTTVRVKCEHCGLEQERRQSGGYDHCVSCHRGM